MDAYKIIDIIIAILFLVHLIKRDRKKKVTAFHKHIFSRKKQPKPHIISSRSYEYCENDHTEEYIQACWDELEKK